MACLIIAATRMRGLTGITAALAARAITRTRRGATGTPFSPQGVALDWLGYPSLPKLDYQSETLVDEIYRGEDSIVRHWLKGTVEYGRLALDVVHMLGEAGGARHNLQHVAGITRAAKEAQPESLYCGGNISAMRGSGYRPMRKMPP
ncbi:maltodextrin glucosidase [Salmonella enterica subsp. enterica]|uniref:Maltodextrin glucosidase n=1 Tax=Salmonella enterica I TaxID=59201 RepID=A0A447U8U4_SALET|nr:maltodextrin glucosidase [Salmonella enterica subsp. enterica]